MGFSRLFAWTEYELARVPCCSANIIAISAVYYVIEAIFEDQVLLYLRLSSNVSLNY